MHKVLYFIASIFITSCASTPLFDTSQVEPSLTPQNVLADPDASHNRMVLWGGTILDMRNLKNSTQIEVLAYPLNSSHRPMLQSQTLGRFIVVQEGFLEPANYAQGRLLTVLGSVGKNKTGRVGESSYVFPVIKAGKLKIWSKRSNKPQSSFRFGIGIRL